MKENTSSFNNKTIMPRVLRGIDHADLHTKLWDIDLATPIIQAPSAAQGLAHEKGKQIPLKVLRQLVQSFQLALMLIQQLKMRQQLHQMRHNSSNCI